MNAKTNGVGLPETNPNLTTDTQAKVDETLAEIQSGALVVPVTGEELDTFLAEVGYQANTINYK